MSDYAEGTPPHPGAQLSGLMDRLGFEAIDERAARLRSAFGEGVAAAGSMSILGEVGARPTTARGRDSRDLRSTGTATERSLSSSSRFRGGAMEVLGSQYRSDSPGPSNPSSGPSFDMDVGDGQGLVQRPSSPPPGAAARSELPEHRGLHWRRRHELAELRGRAARAPAAPCPWAGRAGAGARHGAVGGRVAREQ